MSKNASPLDWIAREVLRYFVNLGWPDEERFWGRPVLVVSDDGSYARCSFPWCRAESPLLLSVSHRQLNQITALDDHDERSDAVRALALRALEAEAGA